MKASQLCGINQVSLQVGCQRSLRQLSSAAQDLKLAKYLEVMVLLHSRAAGFAQEWVIKGWKLRWIIDQIRLVFWMQLISYWKELIRGKIDSHL